MRLSPCGAATVKMIYNSVLNIQITALSKMRAVTQLADGLKTQVYNACPSIALIMIREERGFFKTQPFKFNQHQNTNGDGPAWCNLPPIATRGTLRSFPP